MNGRNFPLMHPGEILLEEFLKPMGISQYRLAESIRVPARRIYSGDIVPFIIDQSKPEIGTMSPE